MSDTRRVLLCILTLFTVISSCLAVFPHLPTVKAQGSGTTFQVFSWDYSGTVIVDPTLTAGRTFTLDMYVTNIPLIANSTDGGINAFDVTLHYNSSVIKATAGDINPPTCPEVNDVCLFADSHHSPAASNLVKMIDSPTGSVRMAYFLLNGNPPTYNRVDGSGTLFSIVFKVIGLGFTNVTIDQSVSSMTQVVHGGIAPLPYKAVNLNFDNRQPYNIVASPPSGFTPHGKSVATNVTAVQIWTLQSFTEGLHFNISGLPTGAAASFTPVNSTGVLPFTTRLNITTSQSTANGVYPLNVTAVSNVTNVKRWTIYALTVGTVDLDITSVTPVPALAVVGDTVAVAVGVANRGSLSESFTATVSANATQVASQILTLSAGGTQTLNLAWQTTGFSIGRYWITARVPLLPGEASPLNNNMTVGPVVLAPDFRITPNLTSSNLMQTQALMVQITAANTTSAREQLTLTVTGLPNGVTAAFSSQSGLPRFTSTLTLNASSTASIGTFTLTIVGTSLSGIIRMATFNLTVTTRTFVPPTAIFTPSTTSLQSGQNVTFDATASSATSATIKSYDWDFGDGTTATGKIVSHKYSSTGSFTVKLTVTDSNGQTNTTSQTVTVTGLPGSNGGSFLTSLPFLAGIAAAIVVVAGVFLYLRSRKRTAVKPAATS